MLEIIILEFQNEENQALWIERVPDLHPSLVPDKVNDFRQALMLSLLICDVRDVPGHFSANQDS